MPLTKEERLELWKVFVKKWAELVCKELDDDLNKFRTLGLVEKVYTDAYWMKFMNLVCGIPEQVSRTTNEEEKWKLILEIYGHELDLPSNSIRPDVKNRLDWLKRRIAKDFELEITRLIDGKDVSSPIEQIFLMEWKFAEIDEKLGVCLSPHETVSTHDGTYTVDFLIVPEDSSLDRVKVAIELDGHEFHEKSKSQVRKDKARERAIVCQGVTVLRFSGSEVVRNARGCVEEVAQFLKTKVLAHEK